MELQQPTAQSSPSSPIIDRCNPTLTHLVAANDPLVGVARSRTDSKYSHPIPLKFPGVAVENSLLERIKAKEVLTVWICITCPERIRVNRLKADFDLPLVMVQD